MTLTLFIKALALAFIIEGLIPALFPNKWRAYVAKLVEERPESIRRIGLVLVAFGCVLFVAG